MIHLPQLQINKAIKGTIVIYSKEIVLDLEQKKERNV